MTGAGLAAPSRRAVIVGAARAAAGLVVGFGAGGKVLARPPAPADPFSAYIGIGDDDRVTILSAHLEMGQGIHHGIATLVQEELRADWAKVRVEHGWGDPDRFADATLGGRFQSTGGSVGSIHSSWERYRQAGAAARMMLVQAAARAWGVRPDEIGAEDGVLSHPRGDRATYGAFAAAAAREPPPRTVALRPRAEWTYIGDPARREREWDGPCPNHGAYTSDVALPGLLTAVLIRPPRFGARLARFEAGLASQVPGVVAVVPAGNAVAVVAEGMWAALKARDLVVVAWDESLADRTSTASQASAYRRLAAEAGGRVAVSLGDAPAALARAARVVEATYEVPYLAHAALEPLNAVARRNADGSLEVWTASQVPDFDVAAAARAAGVAPDKVVLHVTKAGGSFGRRMALDSAVVVEAVSIATAMGTTAPVKVQWTREDDMRGGRYRPAFVHRIRAGLDERGRLTAWHSSLVGQSIVRNTPLAALARDGVDPMSIECVGNLVYAVPNRRVDVVTPKLAVPVLWWRAVGATHGLFAVECFIDEIAEAAGADPLAFRLSLLERQPAVAAVLRLAADRAGWGTPPPEGRHRGLAVGRYFETCVAQVAEVSVSGAAVTVHRVVCAVDGGIAVNPDRVRAQVEGAVGYGLGPVIASRIILEDGLVREGNFDTYEVTRIDGMPDVEVHVVPSGNPPCGVGEPSLPPVAPAVANAVHAATRQRRRTLPLRP